MSTGLPQNIMPAVQTFEFKDELNDRMVEFRALTLVEEKIWISAKDRAYEVMANTYKSNSEGNNMGTYTDTDGVEKSKVDELN